MNPFAIVQGELKQSRTGVIAMIILIMFSLSLGVAVSSQERAIRTSANLAAHPFDIIVGSKGSTTDLLFTSVYLQAGNVNLLKGKYLYKLDNDPRVAYAAPIGFGDNYKGYPIIGTIKELALANGPLVEGSMFQTIHEAVIGYNVPLKIGDSFVPLHGQATEEQLHNSHGHFRYVVSGRMPKWSSPWDNAILTSIESIWYIHGLPTGHSSQNYFAFQNKKENTNTMAIGRGWQKENLVGVPAIAVKPKEIKFAYQLRQEYRSNPDTVAIFPAEVLLHLYSFMGNIVQALQLFSIATQSLVFIAILISIWIYLAQKQKSLAVLRALGAPRLYVFASVWLQIFIIVFLGCLTGLLLGFSFSWLLSLIVSKKTGLSINSQITWAEVQFSFIVLLLGSLLALIPSTLIYRLPVSKALRENL